MFPSSQPTFSVRIGAQWALGSVTCISVLSESLVSMPSSVYVRLRQATHIGSTLLNITKDGISDANAPATCAEAALYNFTLLLRLCLSKVVQPLIVFVLRHCDKKSIESRKPSANKKVNRLTERTSSSCVMDHESQRRSRLSLYIVAISVALARAFTTRASLSICKHT